MTVSDADLGVTLAGIAVGGLLGPAVLYKATVSSVSAFRKPRGSRLRFVLRAVRLPGGALLLLFVAGWMYGLAYSCLGNGLLTGVPFPRGKTVAAFDSYRAFNGDGYSYCQARVPGWACAMLAKSGPGHLETTLDRRGWEAHFWTPTPVGDDATGPIAMATPIGSMLQDIEPPSIDGDPGAREAELEEWLYGQGSYVAWYARWQDDGPGGRYVSDVDLYVFHPGTCVLVEIYSNT